MARSTGPGHPFPWPGFLVQLSFPFSRDNLEVSPVEEVRTVPFLASELPGKESQKLEVQEGDMTYKRPTLPPPSRPFRSQPPINLK